MNALWNLLTEAARERDGEAFLTDLRSGESCTYAQLLDESTAAAGWLAARGIGPEGRVAYVTKNDPRFFPLLFACARLGAALVPVNVDSSREEVDEVLEDCGAGLVLCDKPDESGHWACLSDDVFSASTQAPEVHDCPAEQDVIFIYTSGTTGRSKGVVLSHRALRAMSATLASVYGYAPGQRFLSMLPNYHINAPVVTGLACLTGRAHVFVTDPYGFTNARLILPYAEEHGLEVLSLTPSIMASLLKFHPDGPDCDLSSVKFGLVGTAHLPEKLWREFEEVFGFPCYQGYGLTETTTWATMTPPDARKRYDSAGVPIGCEVRIDEEGGGEVQIRGDIVMNRYNKRKALTKRQFKDDWFCTGDIGRLDDGQLFITGRIKNIIKRRGILISPEEIDEALRRYPATQDACTVGVPDDLSGERILSACVVPAAELEPLGAFVRSSLSAYKYPDELLAVAEIPRTPMGKPDLVELRRVLGGEKAEAIVKSFDVYRFRRARTPDMPVIQRRIQEALLSGGTLEFSTFWGVGRRPTAAEPDVVAMDRLADFLRVINEAAGRELARLTLILADMHARCNQVAPDVYEPYFAAMGALAEERGFRRTWLSAVWEEHGLDFERVLERMVTNDHLEEWETFELRDAFLEQAGRRCGGDPALAEEYAYRYFLVISEENPAMAKTFADTVFITYNAADFRVALPELPTVHLHSLKPGTAVKPWFL